MKKLYFLLSNSVFCLNKTTKTVLIVMCILASHSVFAGDFDQNGISYTITSATSYTVEVSSGNYSGAITIPSTVSNSGTTYSVTSIGKSAFSGSTLLTSVAFAAGTQVTKFSDYAFYGCAGLASITIPDNVSSIGIAAFQDCISLTSITVPAKVTTIGKNAFTGCTGLITCTFSSPSVLTSIGNSAFDGCEKLTSIAVPESVTTLGSWIFQNCTSLTSLTLSSLLTSLPESLAAGCTKLTSITIPASATSIGKSAFNTCTSLATVTIPSASLITTIGNYAFYSCTNLISITVPNKVISLGASSFFGGVQNWLLLRYLLLLLRLEH